MGEQQQAPGAKDLWVRVAQATEGSESMALVAQHLPRETAVLDSTEERTRYDARAKAAVNRQTASFRDGVCVSRPGRDLGMPPLTGPRLSPDGGKPHVRWEGGGQETGGRAMVVEMSACVGNARDMRHRPTAPSTAPARYPITSKPIVANDLHTDEGCRQGRRREVPGSAVGSLGAGVPADSGPGAP